MNKTIVNKLAFPNNLEAAKELKSNYLSYHSFYFLGGGGASCTLSFYHPGVVFRFVLLLPAK